MTAPTRMHISWQTIAGPAIAAALGLVLVILTLSGGRYWRWEPTTVS